MKWFQDLSFRYKLMIPLVLVAGLFFLFAWLTLHRVNVLGEEVSNLVKVDVPVLDDLLQADRDLYQALVAERTLIFAGAGSADHADMEKQHADNVRQARERFDRAAQTIRETPQTATPETQEVIRQFVELRERWEGLTERVVLGLRSETDEGRAAAVELALKEARVTFDAMRDSLDQLQDVVTALTDSASARTEAIVSATRVQTLVLFAAGIILLALVALAGPPIMISPMRRILHRVEDIAYGEGDLTARVVNDGGDEIGQIARAFNRLLDRLQHLVAQATSSAKQVDDAVERLGMVAIESDEAMLEQLQQIQLVATAMNEMTATVNEVALNTNRAAESARAADAGVRSGGKVVGEASVAIGQLADVVSKAGGAMAALESETDRIGAVLEVIKAIAEQTSLLALNAAIEAARAGDSGRGFAVVASEVRNLASRTQQSTGEIETMIASLQSSTRHVVKIMETGRGMVDSSLEKASQASDALANITQAVTRISDMTTQIASAAEQQTAVSEEINVNTHRIQSLAEHATSANRQTAVARADLASLAQALHAELGQFKV